MLIGNYKIESDALNITLKKRGVSKKTGKETWHLIGYYGNVKAVLHDLVELEVKLTGVKEFETIVKKLEELHSLINSLKIHDKKEK